MRRKFADRNEGIMNPRLRESNYTAGRETWRPGFEQTGNGTMRMNIPKRRQENIPYSAGRMRPGDLYAKKLWEAQHAPESLENTYPLYNMFKDQASNIGSKIGATAGELFGGRSAMADEDEEMRLLNLGIADYNPKRVKGEEGYSPEFLRSIGLSGSPAGALADEEFRPVYKDTEMPTDQGFPQRSWWDPRGWIGRNRGGIASLRRYR